MDWLDRLLGKRRTNYPTTPPIVLIENWLDRLLGKRRTPPIPSNESDVAFNPTGSASRRPHGVWLVGSLILAGLVAVSGLYLGYRYSLAKWTAELNDTSSSVRRKAVAAFYNLSYSSKEQQAEIEQSMPALIRAIPGARTLLWFHRETIVPVLGRALKDQDSRVREMAFTTLVNIGLTQVQARSMSITDISADIAAHFVMCIRASGLLAIGSATRGILPALKDYAQGMDLNEHSSYLDAIRQVESEQLDVSCKNMVGLK